MGANGAAGGVKQRCFSPCTLSFHHSGSYSRNDRASCAWQRMLSPCRFPLCCPLSIYCRCADVFLRRDGHSLLLRHWVLVSTPSEHWYFSVSWCLLHAVSVYGYVCAFGVGCGVLMWCDHWLFFYGRASALSLLIRRHGTFIKRLQVYILDAAHFRTLLFRSLIVVLNSDWTRPLPFSRGPRSLPWWTRPLSWRRGRRRRRRSWS